MKDEHLRPPHIDSCAGACLEMAGVLARVRLARLGSGKSGAPVSMTRPARADGVGEAAVMICETAHSPLPGGDPVG
jgi:hypothetical protein